MIAVTGAYGFIGSCLIGHLNRLGYTDIIAVDDFSKTYKEENLKGKKISARIDRNSFHDWLHQNHLLVQFVFHLGARTDTTEFDQKIFDELNLNYSKEVWNTCVKYGLPLVYASSAATYGDGTNGYDDDETHLNKLKPLNPYGDSKHQFDLWVMAQERKPFFWAGLKFFNVYGPNEYHKGRMASVIFHAFNQIQNTGKLKLFRSHKEGYNDGEQKRDFVYVKDVISVCHWLMENRKNSGIYNLGCGKARTFNDLANAVFNALEKKPNIEYIDTPVDIRDSYQYFTQSNMDKLKAAGYNEVFSSLEDGVADYVKHYLTNRNYF